MASTNHTCSMSGCANRIVARNWCMKHYRRWVRNGSTERAAPLSESERFWAKVLKTDGCWFWTGTVAGGYGQFSAADGSRVTAHRFSWELQNGAIPEGLLACHDCDNPLCVRPTHIFLGDTSANMRDMSAKGRHPKQNSRYWAKLTPAQAVDIFQSTSSLTVLSQRHGVSTSAIASIKSGRRWAHVTSRGSV